jgi:hypothetical protein
VKTIATPVLRSIALLAVTIIAVFLGATNANASPGSPGGWVTTHTATGGVKVSNGQATYGWEPSAGTVHTESAFGCNIDVCIDIQGSGLHVEYFNTQAFGNVGCIRAHHRANGVSIFNSALVCPSSSGEGVYYSNYHYSGNFFNGEKLCATWDKISGKPCETVQR